MRAGLIVLLAAMLGSFAGCERQQGAEETRPASAVQVQLNSDFIDQVHLDGVDLEDWSQVLAIVLDGVGEQIIVYPSEGYFYFSFYNQGDLIRGNLRFDLYLRDEGKLAFAYFRERQENGRRLIDQSNYFELGPDEGVFLDQIDPLTYHLNFEEFSLPVELYNAERELAAPKRLNDGEIYVGPAFDESGVRFHFIFDTVTNVFLFVLNEDFGATETYRVMSDNPSVLIGNRTRFAYFDDQPRDRRILFGVSYDNVQRNTYYDGPFDQLPDNFVDPEFFMELILLYNPSLEGIIGPRGQYLSDSHLRAGIYPYMQYTSESYLAHVSECEDLQDQVHQFNRCLADMAAYSGQFPN